MRQKLKPISDILKRFGLLALCAISFLTPPGITEASEDETPSAEQSSTYVMILFLYDLNKQWHALRAATYTTKKSCEAAGKQVAIDLQRVVDKKLQQTSNYYCLRADKPY